MIHVFCGGDRTAISREVTRILGEGYEVFEGKKLEAQDIVNICKGRTLFSDKRKILVKDLTPARASAEEGDSREGSAEGAGQFDAYAEFARNLPTEHEIVIWETNVSRKKSYREFLKLSGVSERRFDLAEAVDAKKVFDIFDIALADGGKAVVKLREIEDDNDPYMFFGLLASQAIRKYEYGGGARERRILKELAELDMQMKKTSIEPWRLIEAFLARVGAI